MKKLFLLFLACCLCLTAFVSCAEVDVREDKMAERKTFASKEEMLRYLSGAEAREMGISRAGEWAFNPKNTMESFQNERCDYEFGEDGSVTYSDVKSGIKIDLTEKVTFVPEKGYMILPDGVKIYCETFLIEQKDSDKEGKEAREFVCCF